MTENKTLKNLYQIWLKENNLSDNKQNFDRFLNSVLTFQDHHKIWLSENNKSIDEWSYEKWINDYCFNDLKGVL